MSLFFTSFVVAILAIPAFAASFDFRFTNPECRLYPGKPKNAFCTRADLPSAQQNSEGPYQKVIQLLKSSENRKITLATMSFSNKGILQELCSAINRQVQVDVIADSGVELATAIEAEKCGASLYKIGSVESEDQRGDLHHNKFLLVEQTDADILVFATGNFSNPALTINHETWSFMNLPKNSKLVSDHKCLITALKRYKTDMNQFKKDLNACRIKQDQATSTESLFVPADSARLVQLIQSAIQKSSQVLMTSNRYSYDLITNAFETSQSKDSRAIFDDDLYWGGLQPTPDYINEALDAKKLQRLERAIPVRYMQTSFSAAQKMHNKFIVFDKMVIVGAGNYTYAGMTSNFENFYVIRDLNAVGTFKKQFEYLWQHATDRSKMPKVYSDVSSQP